MYIMLLCVLFKYIKRSVNCRFIVIFIFFLLVDEILNIFNYEIMYMIYEFCNSNVCFNGGVCI